MLHLRDSLRTLRGFVITATGAAASLTPALAGCAFGGSSTGAARDVSNVTLTSEQGVNMKKKAMTEAELQDEIERVFGQWADQVTQAMQPLVDSSNREVSNLALRSMLVYASSALEIATGPLPEVNLLDMIVFAQLCGDALESYWIPEVYGEEARPVAAAFRKTQADLWAMSAPVLDAEGRAKLESLIADWRRENPNQYRVERVRLMDFAQHAGRVEEERAKAAGGILSNVKQATQTVDQALLLGERAVFMAHRMPFLVRLQGRVGAREMLSDAVSELRSPTSELMGRAEGLEPMVGTLTTLVERSADTTREARRLVEQVTPLSPSPEAMERLRDTITKADALTTHTTTMLQELHGLAGGGANGPGAMVSQRAEGLLKRAVLYLALLGGAWSMAWWGGYFIVKRRLARGS